MEERIKKALGENAVVRRPPSLDFGDYAVFVGPDKVELAVQAISSELGDVASKIEVAGKGFVNITLAREAVMLAVAEADAKKEEWGRPVSSNQQTVSRVMVEYSNPNAFKEMHIGHLVGTVIGEALSRLIENTGAKVARDTFGGDIG
ncbi:MAG: arginine--tRNA ligase, partial [bacterium]|nr:arginine--tRNA ligase [bacterium]